MEKTKALEYAAPMLAYKEQLQRLIDFMKDLDTQISDNLQNTLVKSSQIIKISKNIKEIQLMIQTLEGIPQEDASTSISLFISLRRKVFETQCMLIEQIQKSLLKAVEAMTEAGEAMSLISDFNGIIKVIDKIDEGMKNA